ncbi:hypothetical protein [Lacticaseibacillus saniviri]
MHVFVLLDDNFYVKEWANEPQNNMVGAALPSNWRAAFLLDATAFWLDHDGLLRQDGQPSDDAYRAIQIENATLKTFVGQAAKTAAVTNMALAQLSKQVAANTAAQK